MRDLSAKQYKCFPMLSDGADRFRDDLLRPLLIERVPGTSGNRKARQHIISKLQSTNIWDIEFDSFDAMTPVKCKRLCFVFNLIFILGW